MPTRLVLEQPLDEVVHHLPGIAHIILEVVDDGEPSLTSYRRIIVNIQPAADVPPAGAP